MAGGKSNARFTEQAAYSASIIDLCRRSNVDHAWSMWQTMNDKSKDIESRLRLTPEALEVFINALAKEKRHQHLLKACGTYPLSSKALTPSILRQAFDSAWTLDHHPRVTRATRGLLERDQPLTKTDLQRAFASAWMTEDKSLVALLQEYMHNQNFSAADGDAIMLGAYMHNKQWKKMKSYFKKEMDIACHQIMVLAASKYGKMDDVWFQMEEMEKRGFIKPQGGGGGRRSAKGREVEAAAAANSSISRHELLRQVLEQLISVARWRACVDVLRQITEDMKGAKEVSSM